MTADKVNLEQKKRFFEKLYLVRQVEERIAKIYPSDKIKSPVHLSIGQESVAVGVCEALDPGDAVSGTYRGHATYLARGGSVPGMFAELFGKATGVARGKGGSMHLVDMSRGVLGTSAVVGSTIPVAAGYALAQKAMKTGQITAEFFGDGATEEGVFYETLNFAALRKLPLLMVCENNGYAIHEPIWKRQAADRLIERTRTYGIEAIRISSGDVFEIYEATRRLVEKVRAGEPALLECMIYRWREHVGPGEDFNAGYRSADEMTPWIAQDSLSKLAEELPASEREPIETRITRIIDDAVAAAEASPEPEIEELFRYVYA